MIPTQASKNLAQLSGMTSLKLSTAMPQQDHQRITNPQQAPMAQERKAGAWLVIVEMAARWSTFSVCLTPKSRPGEKLKARHRPS